MADSQGAVFDTNFAGSRYGMLRIVQFVIGLLCLIVVEIPRCSLYHRSVSFFVFVASATLVFTILVMIIFFTRFYEQLQNFINLPLSLLVNECIAIVLWFVGATLILFVSCNESGAKVAFIIAAILGYGGMLAFIYSAKISYNWFQSGTLVTVIDL